MDTFDDTQKAFKKAADEIVELHSKKNENYGNSFSKLFNELGEMAGLVPLYNKLDRLTNLVKGKQNYFESKEDTLKDLASYALMMLVEIRRKEDEKTHEVCGAKELNKYNDTVNYTPVGSIHGVKVTPSATPSIDNTCFCTEAEQPIINNVVADHSILKTATPNDYVTLRTPNKGGFSVNTSTTETTTDTKSLDLGL